MLRSESIRRGETVRGYVVLDFEGIGMKQFSSDTLKCVKKLIGDDSDNYPDSMRKLLMVNTPGFFSFVWRLLKPLIHPKILGKIGIFGNGPDMKAAFQALGVADICCPPSFGGSASPIPHVTNAACYLPFGQAHCGAPRDGGWDCQDIREAVQLARAGGVPVTRVKQRPETARPAKPQATNEARTEPGPAKEKRAGGGGAFIQPFFNLAFVLLLAYVVFAQQKKLSVANKIF